jgi:Tol biopolymer transport system component
MYLSAQSNFLAGVRTEDLMLDRTDVITNAIEKEIEKKGIDYWYLSTDDITYSVDRSFVAEERKMKTSGKPLGLWILDTKSNIETHITSNIIATMAWSVDNKYLTYVQYEFAPDPKIAKRSRKPVFNSERLCIYDHQSGKVDSVVFMKGFAIKHKWSPVGNRLAYSYVDNESKRYALVVLDIEADESFLIDNIILCDLWNFDWAPTGEMLVYTKPLEIDRLVNEEVPLKSEIYIVDYDGSNKTQLTESSEAELFVKWLPDGMKIVTEVVRNPASGYAPTHRIISLQRKEGK